MRLWLDFIEKMRGQTPWKAKRSTDWPEVSKSVIAEVGACEACTSKKGLAVHHLIPFWLSGPERELDRNNLMVLCTKGKYGMKNCHLNIGHNGHWKRFNVRAREDALAMRNRIKGIENG